MTALTATQAIGAQVEACHATARTMLHEAQATLRPRAAKMISEAPRGAE